MPPSTLSIKWPIIGTWNVEGHQEAYQGVLFAEDVTVYLRIFLEIPGNPQQLFGNALDAHPRLAPFRPPHQPTVFGETKVAGKVTLLNCVLSKHEGTHQFDPPISRVEITLRVSQGWAGDGFVDRTALYNALSFTAPGLHSVLSASRLELKFLIPLTADCKSDTHDLKMLTGADEAFLFFHGTAPSAEITNYGKTYKIVFSTSVGGGGSNIDGDAIRTTDSISIETTGATLSELMNVANQVEQFLSLLCVGPFQGERIQLEIGQAALGQFATAELICSIEREPRSPALTRMPHQILASIGRRPELAAPALSSWFGAPNSRRLARWLIFDSLFEDTSATAKFLAVAQAWEILGRDEVNAAAYDKKQYQKACKAAREALEKHLDASMAQRLYELARASNRKSFGDMVREVISKIPPPAVQALCPDVDSFVNDCCESA